MGQAGQTFRCDPAEGRPDGEPSVAVLSAGLRISAAIGACTIDPVDTVLHGDAYRGSVKIRVADPTGLVVGGRYLMTKPDGEREWLDVLAIAGDAVTLKHPILHRYAGAATIRGCRISIAVDPAWSSSPKHLSDTGRHRRLAGYMLRWTYGVEGREVTAVTWADLVTVPSSELVSPQDVDRRNPGWIASLPPEHRATEGADFISEAVRVVRQEAFGDGYAARKIRDARVLRELVQTRAAVIRLEHEVLHGNPRASELAVAETRYRTSYAQLVKPLEASYIEPTEAAKDKSFAKGSEPGVARRIPKLTRF